MGYAIIWSIADVGVGRVIRGRHKADFFLDFHTKNNVFAEQKPAAEPRAVSAFQTAIVDSPSDPSLREECLADRQMPIDAYIDLISCGGSTRDTNLRPWRKHFV
ncbi:hypothetical protein D3C71_992570 [compost metagenome]